MLLVGLTTGVVPTDCSRDTGEKIDDNVMSWLIKKLDTVLSSGTDGKVVLTVTVSTGDNEITVGTDEDSTRLTVVRDEEKPMVEVTWLVVNTGVGVTTGDENCTVTELVVSKTSDLSNPAVLESTTVSSSGVTD